MNTELDDVWTARDYPMLVAIMRRVDDMGLPVQNYELEIDLNEDDQHRALRALEARGLVTLTWRGPEPDGAKSVDGKAYTFTGLHPDGDELRERLVSVLEQLSDRVDDEEEATALRKTARQFGHFSRDTAAAIAAAFVTGGVIG